MRLLASLKDPLSWSFLILGWGAALVPASHREEWSREWQAEIRAGRTEYDSMELAGITFEEQVIVERPHP